MTLATRCPSCGTVFRVVQDQLRVSEGWVRCGRCNGVFDATEVLFDIDSGAAVSLQLPEADATPVAETASPALPMAAPAPAPPASTAPPAPPAPPAPSPRLEIEPSWMDHGPVEPTFAASGLPDATPDDPYREEPLLRAPSRSNDDQMAEPDERIVITDHVPDPMPSLASAETPAAAAGTPPTITAADGPAPDEPALAPDLVAALPAKAQVQGPPSFMRTAERAAVWRRPLVRAGLWLGVLLLGGGVLAQMAQLWRDNLAAHWPAARPALQALCHVAGCSVQPLRRIEQLSVDSSGLNRLAGSTLYQLQLVLRNRADTAVMMPALDLALNDAQGRLVSRRVLQVAELLPSVAGPDTSQAALQAGQQVPIKVLVSTGERRVDGYTLELFYP